MNSQIHALSGFVYDDASKAVLLHLHDHDGIRDVPVSDPQRLLESLTFALTVRANNELRPPASNAKDDADSRPEGTH
jgi:hypothetical protein